MEGQAVSIRSNIIIIPVSESELPELLRRAAGVGAELKALVKVADCDGDPGIAATRAPCPLWVKSGHWGASEQCPLYLQKRTLELSHETTALCQKQTSEHVRVMSALPPKADIGTQPRDVRFVPEADIRGLGKG